MLLERFYDDTLAQASYLLGCSAAGDAIVIDPNRNLQQYLTKAAAEGLRITAVTETHIHADFVSGARELATMTGAELLLSGEGGDDWSYRFAAEAGARLLHDGDVHDVGAVRLGVLHTPGHTPEHLSFLVTDRAASEHPIGMFTGDFVFVGDVGRPDLLERAAHFAGTMDTSARGLFHSLQRTRGLPDHLQLWPGHGAGSACGKALGAVPSTTLGYERLANWAFQIDDEDSFVRHVLAGQPEPPRYFAVMKSVNRDGPAPRSTSELRRVSVDDTQAAVRRGAVIVDVRPTSEYSARHVIGAVAVPYGRSFTNYAGTVLSYDDDYVVFARDEAEARRARLALSLIGTDRVIGWTSASNLDAWSSRHLVESLPAISVEEASNGAAERILDVRGASEWAEGHIPSAEHAYLGDLLERVAHVPHATPLVLLCETGSRSVIAASVLRRAGFTNVRSLSGGLRAWQDSGLPIEK